MYDSKFHTAVDPRGCGCTECITGEYVPLEDATDADMARLATGLTRNNTSELYRKVVYYDRYNPSREWVVSDMKLPDHNREDANLAREDR